MYYIDSKSKKSFKTFMKKHAEGTTRVAWREKFLEFIEAKYRS